MRPPLRQLSPVEGGPRRSGFAHDGEVLDHATSISGSITAAENSRVDQLHLTFRPTASWLERDDFLRIVVTSTRCRWIWPTPGDQQRCGCHRPASCSLQATAIR